MTGTGQGREPPRWAEVVSHVGIYVRKLGTKGDEKWGPPAVSSVTFPGELFTPSVLARLF